jgi:hypothetical protein
MTAIAPLEVHDSAVIEKLLLLPKKKISPEVSEMLQWTAGRTIEDIVKQLRSYAVRCCGIAHEHPGSGFTQFECPVRASGSLSCGHVNDPYIFPFQEALDEAKHHRDQLSPDDECRIQVVLGSPARALRMSALLAEALKGELPEQQPPSILRRGKELGVGFFRGLAGSFGVSVPHHRNRLIHEVHRVGLELADLDVAVRTMLPSDFQPNGTSAYLEGQTEYMTAAYTNRQLRLIEGTLWEKRKILRRALSRAEVLSIVKERQRELGEEMGAVRDRIVEALLGTSEGERKAA